MSTIEKDEVDTMLAIIDRQIIERQDRVQRRQKKADRTAARLGHRHAVADGAVRRQQALLDELRELRKWVDSLEYAPPW